MKAKKRTARGRKLDRALVAGGQDYEVRYESKKGGKSASSVKKAVKKVGSSRKRASGRWAALDRKSVAASLSISKFSHLLASG